MPVAKIDTLSCPAWDVAWQVHTHKMMSPKISKVSSINWKTQVSIFSPSSQHSVLIPSKSPVAKVGIWGRSMGATTAVPGKKSPGKKFNLGGVGDQFVEESFWIWLVCWFCWNNELQICWCFFFVGRGGKWACAMYTCYRLLCEELYKISRVFHPHDLKVLRLRISSGKESISDMLV